LGYGKPDKRIFEVAIELSDGSKQILYFDDMPEYVVEAKKFGISAHQYTGVNPLREILKNSELL
jgi:FMN phosphatase YigB (HAD superfamily)